MRKLKSLPKLKKDLWRVFTKWVKQRDKNICYTCGKTCFGWDCHGGHFIPKSIGGIELYFHEQNVHVQCARCNLSEQGNQYVYGKRLGDKKVKELNRIRISTKNVVWDRSEFEKRIAHYKALLK